MGFGVGRGANGIWVWEEGLMGFGVGREGNGIWCGKRG